MKIALVTGDHLRHKYLRKSLGDYYEVHWIIEKREKFIPEPPKECNDHIKKLFNMHFDKRKNSEHKFFKEVQFKNLQDTYELNGIDFNKKLFKIIDKIRPDVLISYGCNKIEDKVLNLVKYYCWNIHGGLSPWYRGTITHFWPSYFLEPQFTGMTLHNTTSKIDGGNIIHQTCSALNIEDGIHDHACRNVQLFCEDLLDIIKKLLSLPKFEPLVQGTTGKIWTNSMWNPNHLKVIYDLFDDKINKYCIENNLIERKPKLLSILKY